MWRLFRFRCFPSRVLFNCFESCWIEVLNRCSTQRTAPVLDHMEKGRIVLDVIDAQNQGLLAGLSSATRQVVSSRPSCCNAYVVNFCLSVCLSVCLYLSIYLYVQHLEKGGGTWIPFFRIKEGIKLKVIKGSSWKSESTVFTSRYMTAEVALASPHPRPSYATRSHMHTGPLVIALHLVLLQVCERLLSPQALALRLS